MDMEAKPRVITTSTSNDDEIALCCGTTCNKGLILNQIKNYQIQNQLLTEEVERLLIILNNRKK